MKNFFIGVVLSVAICGIFIAHLMGKIKSFEEKEVIFLDLACADKNAFRDTIAKNKDRITALERNDFSLPKPQTPNPRRLSTVLTFDIT